MYIAFIYFLLNYSTNDLLGTNWKSQSFGVNLSMETWASKGHRNEHNGGTVGRQNTVFFSVSSLLPFHNKKKKKDKMKNN